MGARKILRKAADLIETDGWCQGQFKNAFGQHCALGAIQEVATTGDRPDPFGWIMFDEAAGALREHLGVRQIGCWNDDPKRTKAEVVAALREAGKKR